MVGGATAYLGGATAYLVGGKMNLRIRLTSAKVGVGVEVEAEAELGNIRTKTEGLRPILIFGKILQTPLELKNNLFPFLGFMILKTTD